MILIAGFIVGSWVARAMLRVLEKRNVDVTLRQFMASSSRLVVVGLFVIIALSKLGISMTPIIAAVGGLAVGASFALQGRCPITVLDSSLFSPACSKWAIRSMSKAVLAQNWLFLKTYRKLREKLLRTETWHLFARLGPKGFQTPMWDFNVQLLTLSRGNPRKQDRRLGEETGTGMMYGLDVSELRTAGEKAERLVVAAIKGVKQVRQLANPDARVALEKNKFNHLLNKFCYSHEGLTTGDLDRYIRKFYEVALADDWRPYIQNATNTTHYGGRTDVVFWRNKGELLSHSPTSYIKGYKVWGDIGLRVTQMRSLPVTTYTGEIFGKNAATVIPDELDHLPAIWCFCSSPEYHKAVRRIDQTLKVTNATLIKVPFDIDRWTKVASGRYPNGLPPPYSNDPTQWIYHGHPCGSVVWDNTGKSTAHGPLRTDPTVLRVAVARLLGYRWPAEQDAEMELAAEQREWVTRCQELLPHADKDGIVCIPSVRGESPAGDRLLALLAASFGDAWNDGVLGKVLSEAGSSTLDDYLRHRFFDDHCKLFHHRPFVWHIHDGRRDGFQALVSYHKLAEGQGKGRRLLESLTYSYLGDWITRQRDGVKARRRGSGRPSCRCA